MSSVPPEPGSAKPDPILVVDDLRRRFGGLVAVDVDHVEIQRSSITALIGPNGAGKTTFFNLVTGFDEPDAGRWTFDGRPMQRLPPHRVARGGMVRTFQLTKALARMSVMDNMKLGAPDQRGENFFRALVPSFWRAQEAEVEARAESLLERFRLTRLRDEYAGALSGGQRKLLEMARALMSDPTMVLLDEPMAGVNPALGETLLAHIQSLRDLGKTVLFVEHDMDAVNEISDWVVVMGEGRIIAEGPPEAIGNDHVVIDAYLGSHHDAPATLEEEQRQLDELTEATARESE
ncbi:MAG: ABC transporter ATP-binding protein [Actinobacteria bacterium]|nr:MAG: ABC transporter ATP-binding protein [Actinomycetota bacterium]